MRSIKTLLLGFILFLHVGSGVNATETPPDEPVYIEYNDLIYDQPNDVVIFKGDVLMFQGQEILSADEMHYHKQDGKYYVKGNIAILKEDGSIYFADILNLDRFLYKGKGLNFKGRMSNQGIIAASEVEMKSKSSFHLNNVKFTLCKICKNNLLPNIPFWQIKAKEANIDRDEEEISYKDASVDVLGAPVFYTPYLVTPTPGAKRKSGFLSPTVKWSNELGYSLRTSYYWNIAPNMDATAAVRFYTRDDPLLEAQFRHLVENGEYTLDVNMINTKKVLKDGTVLGDQKQIRASYDFKSIFKIPNSATDLYTGLNSMRVYDKSKTYLRKYHLGYEDVLTTNAFIKNFWDDHNYTFLDTIYFQNLNTAYTHTTWQTSPRIVPWLRSYFSKELGHNSKLYLDIDVLNLYRHTGSRYQRFSSSVGYKIPFIIPYGQLIEFGAKIRGDHYQIGHSKNLDKYLKNNDYKGKVSNFYPQLSLEWSLPLVNYTSIGVLTISPIAKMIVEPNKKVSNEIPNEDSQFFELSALNFMSDDRYLGLDRLEVGTRFNYGIRGNLSTSYIENIGFKAGQVINLHKHDSYGEASGLKDKKSDYVAEVYIQPVKEVYVSQKTRLNDKNLSVVRNEIFASVNLKEWHFTLNYMKVGKNILESMGQKNKIYSQDLMSQISYNVYDNWWLGGHIRTKLGRKIPGLDKKIVQGAHINYLGDCLHTFFTVERNYTQLNDLKPSVTYSMNVKVPGF